MEKIIYGSLEIKDKVYPFLLEGYIVKIVVQSAVFLQDFRDETCIESIHGITHDNRDILFLNCDFIKSFFGYSHQFVIDGYILSENNNKEYKFQIDALSFYSDAINTFYPPQQARTINDWRDPSTKRQITFLPTKETKCIFEFNGDKYSFSIDYSVNLRYGSKGLGEISSKISVEFGQSLAPIKTIDYIRKIYDFLMFVNIYVFQRNENGLLEKRASLNFYQKSSTYENDITNSITIDDIDNNTLVQLFEVATSIRGGKNKLQLYYPDNKKDRRKVDPIKWLSKALAFEGLFEEKFPEHKAKENQSFCNIKKAILDSVSNVQSANRKEKGYYCEDIKITPLNPYFEGAKINYISSIWCDWFYDHTKPFISDDVFYDWVVFLSEGHPNEKYDTRNYSYKREDVVRAICTWLPEEYAITTFDLLPELFIEDDK